VKDVIFLRNYITILSGRIPTLYGENDFILKNRKMDTAILKINLKEEKGKLKQKLASLTEDDLLLEEGRQEELLAKYQAMYFQSEEELEQITYSL
jgi:uncharacterized protein YjbJ (UPF0337 family)